MKKNGFIPYLSRIFKKGAGDNLKIKQSLKGTGFTLIELLFVALIMVLFSTIVLWKYNTGNRRHLLELSAQKVVNDLRRAQNMAISSKGVGSQMSEGGFGIKFDLAYPNSYILFADLNGDLIYNDPNERIEDIKLDSEIEIISVLPLAPLTVVFTPPLPKVNGIGSGNGTIALKSKSAGSTKTITITQTGVIEAN